MGFPYITLTYSLYRWVCLHFRYLIMLADFIISILPRTKKDGLDFALTSRVPLHGEMIQFDYAIFSIGLVQPPHLSPQPSQWLDFCSQPGIGCSAFASADFFRGQSSGSCLCGTWASWRPKFLGRNILNISDLKRWFLGTPQKNRQVRSKIVRRFEMVIFFCGKQQKKPVVDARGV